MTGKKCQIVFSVSQGFAASRCASLSQVNSVLREQLEQAGAVNQGLTESMWKAREDAELCDTRLRREQEVRNDRKNETPVSERQQGKLELIPLRTGELRNSTPVEFTWGRNSIHSQFLSIHSHSHVHFIAMIFELLFPVKTFQPLRGSKTLCKQSGVRAVNGLHLSIQGNAITCVCASMNPGVLVLHLFGITIKVRGAIVCCEQPVPPTIHSPAPLSSASLRRRLPPG